MKSIVGDEHVLLIFFYDALRSLEIHKFIFPSIFNVETMIALEKKSVSVKGKKTKSIKVCHGTMYLYVLITVPSFEVLMFGACFTFCKKHI